MPLAAPVSTLPLLEGDSLSSDEFLRRWEEMPDVRRAELIDGIVYMPSPVSLDHDDFQMFLAGWLNFYALATPGCFPGLDGTWRMGERQVPQPDATLRIAPERGGQSGVSGKFHAGAPELLIEVALSSYSRDFGVKKRLYERMGVREYLIAVPREQAFTSFTLDSSKTFHPLDLDAHGIFRSTCFPGLWLDIIALWSLNLQAMNQVLQQGLATPEHAAFAAQLASRSSS